MNEAFRIALPAGEAERRAGLLRDCDGFANSRIPVFLFLDLPFSCRASGVSLEEAYEDPFALARAQIVGFKTAVEAVDCDNARPEVNIDFGSVLTAGSYGCGITQKPGELPQFHPWFSSERDLARLEALDPLDSEWRRREARFREALTAGARDWKVRPDAGPKTQDLYPLADVPLNTHSEGPFSIACMIAGMENVCTWCVENPALVSRLVEVLTVKEIGRIRRQFAAMGRPPGPLNLADDYSPFLSETLYRESVLPFQKRLRDAFGPAVRFHSCIPDPRFLEAWRDELRISHFNGFKPRRGLDSLKSDYREVARVFGGRATLEPDLDGVNTLASDEAALRNAARDFLSVFGRTRGVKLCATLSGAHGLDDLSKMNVLKRTVLGEAEPIP